MSDDFTQVIERRYERTSEVRNRVIDLLAVNDQVLAQTIADKDSAGVLVKMLDGQDKQTIARQKNRTDEKAVENIHLLSRFGNSTPLKDLTTKENRALEKSVYHKNLMQVDYIVADVTGDVASPTYAIINLKNEISKVIVGLSCSK